MSTLEQLKNIFVEYTGNDVDNFSEDTVFTVDMVMNSFEIFGLICEVEEHFGIEIPDRELMKLVTVGDLVKFIDENA
ncbi:MAG: acyl carrier protein [Clostridia bacterium]|nr:acyl carrier protein [Clostridia bacterium]